MNLRFRLALCVSAAAGALVVPAIASAGANQQLTGTVGPGFTINLRDAAGAAVTRLDPGTYDIVVDDRSEMHNFHLRGPGVDQATDVEFIGSVRWTVTVENGTYTFVCDPHSTSMRGSFRVGAATTPKPKPKPKRLTAAVGPGFTISLRNASGRVRSLKAGRYRITVRDRSRMHNFHLVGAGVNKRTAVRFRGTVTWTVTLRKGKTYRFRCDPHARGMRGSFKVT